MLGVKTFVNAPVPSNCYVLYDKTACNDCIIIDPGTKDENELVVFLNQNQLQPKFIILTHEHFDHCWGVNELVSRYHIPIICSELCAECIRYEKRNCSVFYDNKESFSINSPTISVESIQWQMLFGNTIIRFYLTPGHTDASISIVVDNILFTGDTLIKDERTVTKLPTGSTSRLQVPIMLYSQMQGGGYKVYPGHGEIFDLDGYDLIKMNNKNSKKHDRSRKNNK